MQGGEIPLRLPDARAEDGLVVGDPVPQGVEVVEAVVDVTTTCRGLVRIGVAQRIVPQRVLVDLAVQEPPEPERELRDYAPWGVDDRRLR
jgi:hypothetical protein